MVHCLLNLGDKIWKTFARPCCWRYTTKFLARDKRNALYDQEGRLDLAEKIQLVDHFLQVTGVAAQIIEDIAQITGYRVTVLVRPTHCYFDVIADSSNELVSMDYSTSAINV